MCGLRLLSITLLGLVVALVAQPRGATAVEGGGGNYIAGLYGDFAVAVDPGPGVYLRNNLYFYSGETSRTALQGRVRAGVEANMLLEYPTVLWVTDLKVLGARYGMGIGVPLLYVDLSASVAAGPFGFATSGNRFDIGDIYLIPVSLYWNAGNFHINFYQGIVAPTGAYDVNRLVNTGLNYWSFDSVLAVTYLNPKSGLELSAAFGYIYNTENHATNYKSGQEIHLDYMLNQYLSDRFAIGVHGFYYKQISGDSGSGAVLGPFKGEAAGIGPAILWTPKIPGAKVTFIAKWLHEFHARRRLKGNHFLVSAVFKF